MKKFYLYVRMDNNWMYVTSFKTLKQAEFALNYYFKELGYACLIRSMFFMGGIMEVKKEYVYVH